MKRILLFLVAFAAIAATAQNNNPVQHINQNVVYRINGATQNLIIGRDTVIRPRDSAYAFVALKQSGDSIALFAFDSTVSKKWRRISGNVGGGTPGSGEIGTLDFDLNTGNLSLTGNSEGTSIGLDGRYLRLSDSSEMLNNYRHWVEGYLKAPDILGKLNISDTALMLKNYRWWENIPTWNDVLTQGNAAINQDIQFINTASSLNWGRLFFNTPTTGGELELQRSDGNTIGINSNYIRQTYGSAPVDRKNFHFHFPPNVPSNLNLTLPRSNGVLSSAASINGQTIAADSNGLISLGSDYMKTTNWTANQLIFANGAGVLSQSADLTYNAGTLNIGNAGFGGTNRLSINGGRGYLDATGFGWTFGLSGGLPFDASKHFRFRNNDKEYIDIGSYEPVSANSHYMKLQSGVELIIDSLKGVGDRYIGADAIGRLKIMPTPGTGTGNFNATITSPTTGQMIRYNGSAWVNTAIQAADLPTSITSSTSGTAANITTTTNTTLTTLSALSLPVSQTTGTVPVNRGGTGAVSLTGILMGNGASAVTGVNTNVAGQLLRRNLSNNGFEWFTPPYLTAETDASALKIANNLSDVTNAATARTNLGLGNVNNTSDLNKPISTATLTALNTLVKGFAIVPTDSSLIEITRYDNTKDTFSLQVSKDSILAHIAANLKTVNGESLIGSGNITAGGAGIGDVTKAGNNDFTGLNTFANQTTFFPAGLTSTTGINFLHSSNVDATNYSRIRGYFDGGTFRLNAQNAGTGSQLAIAINGASFSSSGVNMNTISPINNGNALQLNRYGVYSHSTGNIAGTIIGGQYSGMTGTAAAAALMITPNFGATTASGPKYLLDLGTNTSGSSMSVLTHISKATIDTSGNVRANSFIKTGGTALQYLMADGSTSTGVSGPTPGLQAVSDVNSETTNTLISNNSLDVRLPGAGVPHARLGFVSSVDLSAIGGMLTLKSNKNGESTGQGNITYGGTTNAFFDLIPGNAGGIDTIATYKDIRFLSSSNTGGSSAGMPEYNEQFVTFNGNNLGHINFTSNTATGSAGGGPGYTGNTAMGRRHNKTRYTTASTAAGTVISYRPGGGNFVLGNGTNGGFDYTVRFGFGSTVADELVFIGLNETNANLSATVNPSAITNATIGIGKDAADANLHILHGDGAGVPLTKVNTGIPFTAGDDYLYTLRIVSTTAGVHTVTLSVIGASNNSYTYTLPSNIPVRARELRVHNFASNNTSTGNIQLDLVQLYNRAPIN